MLLPLLQPVWLHGSLGREAATGRGTVFAIRELFKAQGLGDIKNKSFVIQVGVPPLDGWAARVLWGQHPGSSCSSAAPEGGLQSNAQRRAAAPPRLAAAPSLTPKAPPVRLHSCLQGFGNVGSWAAQILYEMGGRVVAVADAFGAVANEHGLEIPELRRHLADKHK